MSERKKDRDSNEMRARKQITNNIRMEVRERIKKIKKKTTITT